MRHGVQCTFALNRLQPPTAEPIEVLLATQVTEYRLNHRLALTKNSQGLWMLHHGSQRVTSLILWIAFDVSPLCRLGATRAQRAVATRGAAIGFMCT